MAIIDKDACKLVMSIEQEESDQFVAESLTRKDNPFNPKDNHFGRAVRPKYPDIVRTWPKDYSKAKFHTIGTPFWQQHSPEAHAVKENLSKVNKLGREAVGDAPGRHYIPKKAYGAYAEQVEKREEKKKKRVGAK